MTRLLLMGAPGAGKGTQARVVAAALDVPAVSTGDIFRSNVADGTPLGRQAKAAMDRGDYVPDELTNAMVRDRLGEDDAEKGFVLDGYPRTTAQVEFLDGVLGERGAVLERVLVLTVPREELVARLLRRAELDGRADDTEEIIRRRQEVYAEQTAPLLDTYRARGLLVEVDGTGSVDDVTERALAVLR